VSADTAGSGGAPAPLDDILARLTALHPKRIDLTLDRMWRLLAALGHPERRLPPVIHVAGTNGKGSTVAYLRAMLEAAGLRVHTYTSPHLVRINERFRLGATGGGVLADDDVLRAALAECERANAGAPATVFEMETVAAFLLFAQHAADAVLLEVGLGGRLDATNVVEQPAVSVITPVGLDHQDFLGDTVAAIAGEKAGIIKRAVPVVSAAQLPEAEAVIEAVARRARAPLSIAGQHWHVQPERGRLVFQDERGLLDLSAPRLFGRHQVDNAGLALAALRATDAFTVPQAACEAGIARAEWPARMQSLSAGALLAVAPPGAELWLDGGHNPDGGRVVAAALADLEERMPRPLVVVAGMMGNKDAVGFLGNFTGLTRHLIAVPVPGQDKAMAADALAEAGRGLGLRVETAGSVRQALGRIASLAYEVPPRILITGSLYLAGAVLADNGTPPR
jgi:dihydrofolate synthase/folylpolyglutamate synthase